MRPTLPSLQGIGKASTVSAFCALHDQSTFKSIDTRPFEGTREQAFLFGYRSLCYTLYLKDALRATHVFNREVDRGKSLERQMEIQAEMLLWEAGWQSGLMDLQRDKKRFDEVLLSRNFDLVKHYVIEIGVTPDVLCSGGTQPECDFAGNTLQELEIHVELDSVYFSATPTEFGGAFIFTWLEKEESPCEDFIQSLDALSDDQLPHAVLRFMLEYFENTYMSPFWWESLPGPDRERLTRRMYSWTPWGGPPDRSCLVDDGLRVVDWPVIRRHRSAA